MNRHLIVEDNPRKVRFLAAGIAVGYAIMFGLGWIVAINFSVVQQLFK